MVTVQQGETMQADINSHILKLKEVHQYQETQTQINMDNEKHQEKHANKIDQASDNIELILSDVEHLKKEMGERL